jgi:glycerophosphoryl diester phosphodiesterase
VSVPTAETGRGSRPSHPRVSRRALLAGGIGAAALAAAAVPVALLRLGGRPGGKLVGELLASKPFYVAHRGAGANWPELSMEAYRRSVACGADALEISLARSSDGVWFGLHDATLDRTSGTTDFVAEQHAWAEISQHRIGAAGTGDQRQAPQPYLRFEQLVDAYAGTHTIFVDPKATNSLYYPELLAMMEAVAHPEESFIAKYYCTGTSWARAARARGLRTWGFYYGREVDDGTTPPENTQADWDLLGLDVNASAGAWSGIRSFGKPVIAHVVTDRASARTALDNGADGLMVSDIVAVLGKDRRGAR